MSGQPGQSRNAPLRPSSSDQSWKGNPSRVEQRADRANRAIELVGQAAGRPAEEHSSQRPVVPELISGPTIEPLPERWAVLAQIPQNRSGVVQLVSSGHKQDRLGGSFEVVEIARLTELPVLLDVRRRVAAALDYRGNVRTEPLSDLLERAFSHTILDDIVKKRGDRFHLAPTVLEHDR
jgi:hypothetical protein